MARLKPGKRGMARLEPWEGGLAGNKKWKKDIFDNEGPESFAGDSKLMPITSTPLVRLIGSLLI